MRTGYEIREGSAMIAARILLCEGCEKRPPEPGFVFCAECLHAEIERWLEEASR